MTRLVLMALMSLALMPWARAATFDCAKASTTVEKTICSDRQLSGMDDRLGRLYQDALARASSSAALKSEQRAWLALRDQCADAECLKKAYTDRIVALSGRPAPPSPVDVTGTYKAQTGEVLVRHTADGRIKFSMNATYRTNVGEVSGEVPLTGDAANYVDEALDCHLSFKFAPGTLVLTQDGSCGMGLNVSGAGTYKRVSADRPTFGD